MMPLARYNTRTWHEARTLAIEVYAGRLEDYLVSARLRDFIGANCPGPTHTWMHNKAMKVYKRKLELLQGEYRGSRA